MVGREKRRRPRERSFTELQQVRAFLKMLGARRGVHQDALRQ